MFAEEMQKLFYKTIRERGLVRTQPGQLAARKQPFISHAGRKRKTLQQEENRVPKLTKIKLMHPGPATECPAFSPRLRQEDVASSQLPETYSPPPAACGGDIKKLQSQSH